MPQRLTAQTTSPAQAGIASWYGDEYRGKPTASGEPFDPQKLTAASWDWYGWIIEVRCPATGKSIEVRVNDRGPARYWVERGRIIDLSNSAFRKLDTDTHGLIVVEVRPIRRFLP